MTTAWRPTMKEFHRIAVATDFGPSSTRAVELARDMAAKYGAELLLIHVIEPFAPPLPAPTGPEPAMRAAARTALDAAIERAQLTPPTTRGVVLRGHAAEQIVGFAEQNGVDLVVLGTHGRRRRTHWLIGSVAERVVRSSTVPILTVRGSD